MEIMLLNPFKFMAFATFLIWFYLETVFCLTGETSKWF